MPPRDWPAVRPFRFFPDLEPHRSDTRNSTFVPEGSVDTDIIEELSVTKVTGIGVKIYNTNAQTIAASGTEATVAFGSEALREGFDAEAGSALTIPRDGVYLLAANLEWAAALGETFAWFYINSAKTEGHSQSDNSSIVTRFSLTTVRNLTAGDSVAVRVKQTNGVATRNISGGVENCSLSIMFLFGI